jgi:3-keto-5-aminohexanoate cleavage enzyme
MSDAWSPLIITVAPTGARKTPRDHRGLPITPSDIARTAAECHEAGAAMIHLHVRDATGAHSLDPGHYRAAIEAIRREVGDRLVIQATTEAVGRYSPVQQMALVRDLKPESASMALRELIPDATAESATAEFLAWLVSARIMPQFILYSGEDVRRYRDYRLRGIVPPGTHLLLFVLGRYSAGQTSNPSDLLEFLSVHDDASPWAMCAFGKWEHACSVAAAALGGHVRVGFENNLYLKDGALANRNAELVAQVSEAAMALGRPLADADTVRQMLSA